MPESSTGNAGQAKYWLLTIPQANFTPYKPDCVTYIKGQLEEGAQRQCDGHCLERCICGGYLHWQVLVVFDKKCRLAHVRRVFGNVHAEPTRSAASNEYVWKEETRVAGTQFELGSLPMKRNSKTDWDMIKQQARDNKVEDIVSDVYIRYYGNLKRIAKDAAVAPWRPNIHVDIYWGITGSGKSHRAFSEMENKEVYVKGPTTKWWDSYRGEKHVIMDEFRGQICIEHLLKWFDKYPCYVEEKGGQIPLLAEHFIVCSNLDPRDWYPTVDQPTRDALLRRVNITHFVMAYVQAPVIENN